MRCGSGAPEAVAYDAQGRATQVGADRLVWDALGRLAAVTDAAGNPREVYVWDAGGRLAEAHRPGEGVERFAYDGAHKVASIDASGAARWEAVWGPGLDRLAALHLPSGERSVLTDERRAPVALYDPQTARLSERTDTATLSPGFRGDDMLSW